MTMYFSAGLLNEMISAYAAIWDDHTLPAALHEGRSNPGYYASASSIEDLRASRYLTIDEQDTILRMAADYMSNVSDPFLNGSKTEVVYTYRNDSATLKEHLDSIQVTFAPRNQAAEAVTGVRIHRRWPTSPQFLPEDAATLLAEHYQHLVIDTVTNDSWGSAFVNFTLDENSIEESQRRFIPYAEFPSPAHLGDTRRGWGYFYLEDGVLSLTTERQVFVTMEYALENLPSLTTAQERVAAGRQRYRNDVMSRIRRPDPSEKEQERKRAEHRAKTENNFLKHRASQDAQRNAFGQRMFIPELPFVEAGIGIKSSRNWGIEIETGAGRDLSGTPAGWDSKDDGSLESAYTDTVRYDEIPPEDCPEYAAEHDIANMTYTGERENYETGETITFDAISSDYRNPEDCHYCGWVERDYDDYNDEDCVELVSPILSSMHSRGLRAICADIEHSPRTDTAGVHVHVDASDLTVRQVRELVLAYDHIEFLLEASYDRVERGYCKRRSAQELLRIAREASTASSKEDLRKGDRYVTVNLQALDHHGTIEFRAMGPRYNYDHLIRWAMFCREMLNVVANGASSKDFAKVKTWEDVERIFARYGIEYNLAMDSAKAAEVALSVEEDALLSV